MSRKQSSKLDFTDLNGISHAPFLPHIHNTFHPQLMSLALRAEGADTVLLYLWDSAPDWREIGAHIIVRVDYWLIMPHIITYATKTNTLQAANDGRGLQRIKQSWHGSTSALHSRQLLLGVFKVACSLWRCCHKIHKRGRTRPLGLSVRGLSQIQ